MNNEVTGPVAKKVSIGLVVGIIIVPYIFVWLLLNKGYSNKARYYGFAWLIIAAILFFNMRKSNESSSPTYINSNRTESVVDGNNPNIKGNKVAINETADIGHFAVTVNSCTIKNSLYINEYVKLGSEEGAKFVIIDVSLKNTSSESRMMFEGELQLVGNDGRKLVMDKTELVFSDGYGLLLESINPMLTKRTKIIYKIPSDIPGHIYYVPARNNKNVIVDCGAI